MTKESKTIKQIVINSMFNENTKELKNATIILGHAVDSVNQFYKLFQKNRKGIKGGTTHQDQDLLRAMLVFSCSGLDAVIKQLIKDALPSVIIKEPGAKKEFQNFIERKMKKNNSNDNEKVTMDFK
jgi:hypothetical protein